MAKQKNSKPAKENNTTKTLEHRGSATDIGSRLAATPFAFMKRFGEEMDRLFEDFGFGPGLITTAGREFGPGMWAPQVEMFERDGNLVVRADLPGLTKDDVNVEVNDDGLTIEGERSAEKEEKGEGFYRSERSYGKFYRRLPLPDGVNVSDANATFNNGVLEITMPAPKQTTTKSKRLEITDESRPQAKGKAA